MIQKKGSPPIMAALCLHPEPFGHRVAARLLPNPIKSLQKRNGMNTISRKHNTAVESSRRVKPRWFRMLINEVPTEYMYCCLPFVESPRRAALCGENTTGEPRDVTCAVINAIMRMKIAVVATRKKRKRGEWRACEPGGGGGRRVVGRQATGDRAAIARPLRPELSRGSRCVPGFHPRRRTRTPVSADGTIPPPPAFSLLTKKIIKKKKKKGEGPPVSYDSAIVIHLRVIKKTHTKTCLLKALGCSGGEAMCAGGGELGEGGGGDTRRK